MLAESVILSVTPHQVEQTVSHNLQDCPLLVWSASVLAESVVLSVTSRPVEQTVSHILQDCPLLDQLRQTTWPEEATVRQKLLGMHGETAEDAPVCLDFRTTSVTAIEKKKKKKKKKKKTSLVIHRYQKRSIPIFSATRLGCSNFTEHMQCFLLIIVALPSGEDSLN